MITTTSLDVGTSMHVVGLDIGSTTVKAVCVDPKTRGILWSDYQRHESRQAEKAFELLTNLGEALDLKEYRIFVTGSGAKNLTDPLGAEFVQEVNAVSLAVEYHHPDAGSVIELGGQDAKIIVFKTNPETGEKQADLFDERQVRQRHGCNDRQVFDQGRDVA